MSTHYPNLSAATGLGSVIKSLRKSLRTSGSHTLTQSVPVINPVVVGGSEGQQKLLQQLKSGPLPTRASAAAKVTESLEKYSISSIPEIWYLGRDLCEGRITSQIRRIGIKLMIECIKHDELTVSGKLMYFNDIARYCQITESYIDPEFDLFLLALKTLSNNGKDVHDLYIYDSRKNFPAFIRSALIYLSKMAKTFHTSNEKLSDDKNFQNLHKLLEFVKNCLKLNYGVTDEKFIVSICEIAADLGFQTTNKTILSDCVDLLNTVIAFGSIPFSSFSRVMQVLAYVFSKGNSQSELVGESLLNMALVSAFPTVFVSLCEVAKNYGNPILERDTVVVNTTVGALLLIEKLFVTVSGEKATKTDYINNNAIAATSYVLEQQVPLLNMTVLQILDRFFDRASYSKNYTTTVPPISELFPFQVWYGSSVSMFEIFFRISVCLKEETFLLRRIIRFLREEYQERGLNLPRQRLVKFFAKHQDSLSLDDTLFVISYYKDEKLCSAINPLWKESQQLILSKFVYSTVERDPAEETEIIRLESLRVIKEGHFISVAIVPSYKLEYDTLKDIFLKFLKMEISETVLHYLFYEFFIDISQNASMKVFDDISETVLRGIFSMGKDVQSLYVKKFAESIAKIFTITIDAGKAAKCFMVLIKLGNFGLAEKSTDLLLIVSRTLIRLRVTNENFAYLTTPNDMEGLATAFRRTSETIREDALRSANQGSTMNADLDKGDSDKLITSYTSAHNYKWHYPESLPYLPERFFDTPTSKLLIESDSAYSQILDGDSSLDQDMATININLWMQIVLKILEEHIDWEIYTFVWAHFCSQLSNLQLFREHFESISTFRRILTEHISLTKLPNGLEFPLNVTKADLQVACIRNLSALTGYKSLFSRSELEQMINSTLQGVDYSWEKTAIPVINFLTVCCFDIPLQLKKYLPVILSKLQTRVTNVFAMAHTLEFLLSLIDLPAVISSINLNEYKSVFGICFKYIQYANDIRKRNLNPDSLPGSRDLQAHGVDAVVELTPSTNVYTVTPILSQYLLQLSYDVIAYWFLKIAMDERKMISSFLIKNLILSNDSDMNEQLISMLDFVVRFTFCDIPVKVNQLQSVDRNCVSTKSWIIGYSVLSIIKKMNGKFQVIIRRPTGHIYFDINLNVDDNMVDNEYLLLQLFTSFDEHNKSKPIPLIDDSLTLRNLNIIDRIPMIDYHKIGIIYIGKGQSTEEAVLLNKIGNDEYEKFIRQMGIIIRLKGCKDKYVGGLDTENDTDGEYAVHYSDKLTHIIFHTATMMEKIVWNEDIQAGERTYSGEEMRRQEIGTGSESSPEHSLYLKKRHIGNNYVNIYFDDSGGIPFNFNLIKSQFNFINIVISHHTYSKSSIAGHRRLETNISGDGADLDNFEDDSLRSQYGGKHFKVKLYRRSGIPGILSACHFKIVSEENLSTYVRNLALRSSLFANTWHANGEFFTTIWTHRVKQIGLLREKTIKAHEQLREMEMEEESGWDADDPYGSRGRLQQIGFAGGRAGFGFGASGDNKSMRGSGGALSSLFSGRGTSLIGTDGKPISGPASETDATQSLMQQLNEGLFTDTTSLRTPTTPTSPNLPHLGSSMGTPGSSTAKTKYMYGHAGKHSNGNENDNANELFLLFEFNSYT